MPAKKIYWSFLLSLCMWSATYAQSPTLTGNASYYHDKFHGRRMANGELYNKDSLTCAHLEYPFGTVLKVRNPLNNRTVFVRVTDRGPYSRRFAIDLSRAAANELDIVRTGFSLVEITPFYPSEIPYRLENGNRQEKPEMCLEFTPPPVFPEPIWQIDTIKVSEQLKEVTSSIKPLKH